MSKSKEKRQSSYMYINKAAMETGVDPDVIKLYAKDTEVQRLLNLIDTREGYGLNSLYKETVGNGAFLLGRAVPGAALGVGYTNRFPSLNIFGQLLNGPQSSSSGLTLPGAELFADGGVPIGLSPGEAFDTPGQEFIDIVGQNDSIGTGGQAGSNTVNTSTEERISRINYKPSSGVIIEATPGKTTTIIGNFDRDMSHIIDELGNVKSTDISGHPSGFNVLNVPDIIYNSMSKEQFWAEYNKKWLDAAIARGDDIVLATKPESQYLSYWDVEKGGRIMTSFGKEFAYLNGLKNYVYDAATFTFRMIGG